MRLNLLTMAMFRYISFVVGDCIDPVFSYYFLCTIHIIVIIIEQIVLFITMFSRMFLMLSSLCEKQEPPTPIIMIFTNLTGFFS